MDYHLRRRALPLATSPVAPTIPDDVVAAAVLHPYDVVALLHQHFLRDDQCTVVRDRVLLRPLPLRPEWRGADDERGDDQSIRAHRPSLFQDLLRNRVQLHVTRPLVDRADLGVAVELLNRVLLGVAVAANSSTASEVTRSATCEAKSLAIAACVVYGSPAVSSLAALYTISRAASSSVAACAS